jgi:glycosyltransferase involved in cell wall biosynthesis
MASGVPVVASRGGALAETGGSAAILVEPDDADGFANAIDLLMSDSHEWERRRQEGLLHSAGFTWKTAAQAVMKLLKEAAQDVP